MNDGDRVEGPEAPALVQQNDALTSALPGASTAANAAANTGAAQPDNEAASTSTPTPAGDGTSSSSPSAQHTPDGPTPDSPAPSPPQNGFDSLPTELIDKILDDLSPVELAIVGQVCRLLHTSAMTERFWKNFVQRNIPYCEITTPYPHRTFRDLYIAHEMRWFLPKYKIWFSGRELVGKLLLVKYDQRRGCIEGYSVVAVSNQSDVTLADDPVVRDFKPHIILHMDRPVIKLEADRNAGNPPPLYPVPGAVPLPRPLREVPMKLEDMTSYQHHLMYARALPPSELADGRSLRGLGSSRVWPPPAVPSPHRVLGYNIERHEYPAGSDRRPERREDVSDLAFYIRRRAQFSAHHFTDGVHQYDEFETFSTIDPFYYTPTKDKPFRGIWVGDYAGHGCEFLLIHQPDDEEPFDDSAVQQLEGETSVAFEKRKHDMRIYRGRLEAIKLTGDPHVPRGEFTFIADDLGLGGLDCIPEDGPFAGVRAVKTRGLVAGRGFRNSHYIASRLFLCSPNKLAQHWIGPGHISLFERVDFERFLEL